jgi:hypothetical protein
MRIYEPKKEVALLQEVLKELYLLKQAIDYQSSTVDSRLKMVERTRTKVQKALDILEGNP